MKVRLISVKPLGEGWAVRSDPFANDMIFRSGARAESAARRLGQTLAAAGERAEIRVHDRAGGLVGRFACPPGAAPEAPSGQPTFRAFETA
jgi:hypothetical protein